ncbi:MAG: putative membrane protein YeiH [Candidatus Azotimanducaceae bacterium]|jgi:uncharacterized membrane protein YeiH
MVQVIISLLDLLSIFVFAISGALTAIDKKMDLFGVLLISFVTAIGGGTVRDMLLGGEPVAWIQNPRAMVAVCAGVMFAIVFKKVILKLRKTMFLFDAIGIGTATIIGLQKGLYNDVLPVIAVVFGVMSATFGGLIRDILCNEIPLILRKEIYATACISGAILYLILEQLNTPYTYSLLATISFIVLLRVVSVRYKLSLPVPKFLG